MADWVHVPKGIELTEGTMTALSTADRHLILYRTAGGYFATDRRCTHQRADLIRGYLDEEVIECPVHQGRFSIRTGAPLSAPVCTPLKTYAVKVVDGEVYVEVPQPSDCDGQIR